MKNRIYHYVNLVCWRQVRNVAMEYKDISHIFYCDSRSLQFVLAVLGIRVQIRPGVHEILKLQRASHLFIVSGVRDYEEIYDRYMCCPKSAHGADLSQALKDYSKEYELPANLVFGISSPKQNKLAAYILRDMIGVDNIHCLGAAVDNIDDQRMQTVLPFITFLIKSPGRTLRKLFITILETIHLVLSTTRKNELREMFSNDG